MSIQNRNNKYTSGSYFSYPFAGILLFTLGLFSLWLSLKNVTPKQIRTQNNTIFQYTKIPLKEHSRFSDPLLFAKPNKKGFAADFSVLHSKEKPAIEFMDEQPPIIADVNVKNFKAKTPQVENIVKKEITPEFIHQTVKTSSIKTIKHVTLSNNLKKIKFSINLTPITKNKTLTKRKYAECTVIINNNTIQHIFFQNTNMNKKERFTLNRIIQSAKFSPVYTPITGTIKINITPDQK